MKIQAKKSDYRLPHDFHYVNRAVIYRDGSPMTMPGAVAYALCELPVEQMKNHDLASVGIPSHFFILPTAPPYKIRFWPTPERNFDVLLEYSPHAKAL